MSQFPYLKILPPNYFYGCIFLCLPFYFVLTSLKIINYPYNLIGILLIMAGIYLILKPYFDLKKHGTKEDFSKPTFMVKDGIFRYSRNPMYLGKVIFLAGIALTTGNMMSFTAPVLFFIIMELMFIPYEERELDQLFGQEYRQYKKSVRRWI